MLQPLDEFYLKQPEPNKSCLLALREIILSLDPHLGPAWKYGMPFFCYEQKIFCYLWIDKKTLEPYIGIMEGRQIDHPMLEQGTRSRVKILRVDPNEDLPVELIESILREVLVFYRA